MTNSQLLQQRSLIPRLLERMGVYAIRLRRLPRGIDWIRDLSIFTDPGDGIFLDVGANLGQTTAEIRSRLPNAVVECFEPVPPIYAKLVENTSKMDGVRCHNFAFGASDDTVTIRALPDSQQNSLVDCKFADNDNAQEYSICVRTVDGFLSERGIERVNVLKTDTEGYDLEVLAGAELAVKEQRIDIILSEAGGKPLYPHHTSFVDLLEWAREHRYYLAGVYDQNCLLAPQSPDSFCNIMLVGEWLLSDRQKSRGLDT